MANRSYLYAIDFDRTKGERKENEKILGLSEYPYSIPLSYKILVSQDSKISNSINWDYEYPIAIQGDFEKGKQRLFDFLNKLQSENLFDKKELEKQIDETKDFLNNHQLQNIILECGEIYEMNDEELEDQNKELFEKDILNIESQMNEYLNGFRSMNKTIETLNNEISGLSKSKGFLSRIFSSDNSEKVQELEKKIKNIEQEKWNMLGVNYWSDILYYHFENE
ncbi:DUF7822 domain-containing protein [Tenacibaculum sp. M341]|uniref:DUF7822 domain-containing protein n=1 Tax=Tenacibaculum sp. M341 TaxID=2530339 RepID=UPI00104AA2FC|nr:hypothetical protein [Tenacibaculum sp. M341]TCI93628.1 hypothetical protein EYW44_04240 [Tenacibaculum sp. M341]